MIVMGIKAFGHDTGAAVVADNGSDLEIVAIAEARLNRIKHSWRYPLLSIERRRKERRSGSVHHGE